MEALVNASAVNEITHICVHLAFCVLEISENNFTIRVNTERCNPTCAKSPYFFLVRRNDLSIRCMHANRLSPEVHKMLSKSGSAVNEILFTCTLYLARVSRPLQLWKETNYCACVIKFL